MQQYRPHATDWHGDDSTFSNEACMTMEGAPQAQSAKQQKATMRPVYEPRFEIAKELAKLATATASDRAHEVASIENPKIENMTE